MSTEFNRQNLDDCLRELSKEFRKLSGSKMPAEIILVGGAAILANYGFRDMTYDMDAIVHASSAMSEAANIVGDKFGFQNFWLSQDFKKTRSYTDKLVQYSKYYKKFSNILEIRTINREYLVAMKLMSGRPYKHDLSDVLGILKEHQGKGEAITLENIRRAFCELYDTYDDMPDISKKFIEDVFVNGDFETLFDKYKAEESISKELLIEFDQTYPDVLSQDNLAEILEIAKSRKS